MTDRILSVNARDDRAKCFFVVDIVRQDCREWDHAGSKGISHRRVATRRVPAVWTFGSELDPSQVVAALRDLLRFRGGLEKVASPCRLKRIA